MDLKVPFAEKDAAKKLGARWDTARKLWYVDGKTDLAPFAKWAPTPSAETAGGATSAARQVSSGKAMVGAAYVAHPLVCACPPWELCDKCRPYALAATS